MKDIYTRIEKYYALLNNNYAEPHESVENYDGTMYIFCIVQLLTLFSVDTLIFKSLNGKHQQHVLTFFEKLGAHLMTVVLSPGKIITSTLEGATCPSNNIWLSPS
jgi:hypothetical protein